MKHPSLLVKECKTVSYVSGPLIFVQSVKGVRYGEIVRITLPGRSGEKWAGTGYLEGSCGYPGL